MKRRAIFLMVALSLIIAANSALALNVGDSAPAFTAVSNQGEIRLQDYIGQKNVILAFYFAIFTPA